MDHFTALIQVHSPVLPPLASPDISYSTLEPGLEFSPVKKTAEGEGEDGRTAEEDTPPALGRVAGRNLDLCYFLGNDIFTSHVPCNPNWGDGTNEGVSRSDDHIMMFLLLSLQNYNRYINEFTFQTNKLLGEQNFKLTWKGPYHRHDAATSLSECTMI